MTAERVLWGWRCVACHDESSSPTWTDSQAALDAHWRATHGRPMPEQDELGKWEA